MNRRNDQRQGERLAENVLAVVWGACVLAMGLGVISMLSGSAVGAITMLVGFVVWLGTSLIVGVIGYRRVMSRRWPDVSPVEEEEDDE